MKKIKNEEEIKREFREKMIFVGAVLTFAAIIGAVLIFQSSEPQKIPEAKGSYAMLFESSTCSHCQKFIKETLSNRTIWDKLIDMNLTIMTSANSVQEVEEEWPQFKGLHIYTTKEEVLPYLNMFEINGIPTLVIVTGNKGGKLKYDKYEGYMNESELMKILDKY